MTHGLRARPRSTAFFASSPAATMTDGFEVFVQLVIAAMTTEPCSRSNVSSPIETGTALARLRERHGDRRRCSLLRRARLVPGLAESTAGRWPGTSPRSPCPGEPFRYGTPKLESDSRKDDFASRQRHAVLRAARPGEARLDVAEVELDHLRVLGRRGRGRGRGPASRQYASTSSTCSALRPVRRR